MRIDSLQLDAVKTTEPVRSTVSCGKTPSVRPAPNDEAVAAVLKGLRATRLDYC